jgi:2-methylisocitrate lyase-like PEP mutase family enzyme
MTTQTEKGKAFRALHQRNQAFIIPNPWDIGAARLLAHLGFEALASTSAGYAFSLGLGDYAVGRESMIAHVSALASATDLPVSADLENGFADAPEMVAETIKLAAAAGVVGGSIEDATGRAEHPIYEQGLAAERIRAAAESARALGFAFTVTARAENYLHGRPDLKDTIKRLQAYQEAGADVLYAPGLTSESDISALVSSVDRPVNVLMGISGFPVKSVGVDEPHAAFLNESRRRGRVRRSVQEIQVPGASLNLAALSAIGVRRVSVGSGLARAAFGTLLRAAREMRDRGTFTFAEDAASSGEIVSMFKTRET